MGQLKQQIVKSPTILGIIIIPAFMLVGSYFYVDSLSRFLGGTIRESLIIVSALGGVIFTIITNELLKQKTKSTIFSNLKIGTGLGLLFLLYMLFMWIFYLDFVLPSFPF